LQAGGDCSSGVQRIFIGEELEEDEDGVE